MTGSHDHTHSHHPHDHDHSHGDSERWKHDGVRVIPGNQLDPNSVEAVQKVVETNQNLQVRSAAAEAQGALNLPAERAKNLIINQSQVGK